MINNWVNELELSITVCDTEGVIMYMNDKAKVTFTKYGENLIGRNLKDCHSPESWDKINQLLAERKSNSYTMEKNGVKKLINGTVHSFV